MSIQLMSAVYPLHMPSNHKFVLLMLCDHANPTGVCWPSLERLANHTSLCKRSVQNSIKYLVENNYIKITSVGNGRGKSTHYQMVIHKGAECAPFSRKGGKPEHKGGKPEQKRVHAVLPNHKEPLITKSSLSRPEKKQQDRAQVLHLRKAIGR